MSSNVSEFLSTKFVLQLSLPLILCLVAVIPFVIFIVVFFADIEMETSYRVYTICAIIQLLLFTAATIMWAIIDSKIHIFPAIAIIVWLVLSIRNAFKLGEELESSSSRY